jgi:hypothetical protein
MISVDNCKKILNRSGKRYTDDEVEQIREFLWNLAEIEVKTIEINDFYEDSSINGQSKQRRTGTGI